MTDIASWIAVDWGTSNMRAWVIGPDDTVIATPTSDQGMGVLSREGFEPALLDLVGSYLPQSGKVPVIACGMVGARQGWIEAPYVATPCTAPGLAEAARPEVSDPRLDVRILPGVKQMDPPDVMRGEETQIAGFLADNPDFDGVLCLPGTHTKWVHVSAREMVSFRTFMTGELFALLSRHSVLRFSVGGDGWDDAAFRDGVNDALSSPQNLTTWLFSLRAGTLVNETPADVSRARLSGMLLGLELAGSRAYWLGRDIAIVGDPKLTALYRAALDMAGAPARELVGDDIALAGLKAAFKESDT